MCFTGVHHHYDNLDASTTITMTISTYPLPSTCPTAAKTTKMMFVLFFYSFFYTLLIISCKDYTMVPTHTISMCSLPSNDDDDDSDDAGS